MDFRYAFTLLTICAWGHRSRCEGRPGAEQVHSTARESHINLGHSKCEIHLVDYLNPTNGCGQHCSAMRRPSGGLGLGSGLYDVWMRRRAVSAELQCGAAAQPSQLKEKLTCSNICGALRCRAVQGSAVQGEVQCSAVHYGLTGGPVPSQRCSVFEGCISGSIRL